MTFDTFSSAWNVILLASFLFAVVIGAMVNKTNFCTMGAVSDWVNIGDQRRFKAWMLAIAVAVIGVAVFEWLGWVKADSAFPPYRSGTLIWGENIFGGLLFGIGMTLASGCGNKTLIRFGAGNLKSFFVLLVIGVIAYYMLNPLPNTDQTLYSLLFLPWAQYLRADLGISQDLGTLLAGSNGVKDMRLMIGLLLGCGLLFYVFKTKSFRKDNDNILSGSLIGLAVLGAWLVTSLVMVTADGELYSLRNYYNEWDFLANDGDIQPSLGAALSPQSYTFINPLGQALGYAAGGFGKAGLTFGIVAVLGIIFGSWLWATLTKGFRIEWFANRNDFIMHMIGAILMGFGGVLGMGCTIGQGITGVSTLALGSFITVVFIILGSAITMKTQYYKLVYEDEASLSKAIIAGLADLKLLPNSWRSLDKV
ncbi:MAG: putative membrane protein YedE/YeeE [Gammaproteobacteria bacterium]|jgi:uncharacterized membrane protein YedE/YeeE